MGPNRCVGDAEVLPPGTPIDPGPDELRELAVRVQVPELLRGGHLDGVEVNARESGLADLLGELLGDDEAWRGFEELVSEPPIEAVVKLQDLDRCRVRTPAPRASRLHADRSPAGSITGTRIPGAGTPRPTGCPGPTPTASGDRHRWPKARAPGTSRTPRRGAAPSTGPALRGDAPT